MPRGLLTGLGLRGQGRVSHLPRGNHVTATVHIVMKSDASRLGLTPPEPSLSPGFRPGAPRASRSNSVRHPRAGCSLFPFCQQQGPPRTLRRRARPLANPRQLRRVLGPGTEGPKTHQVPDSALSARSSLGQSHLMPLGLSFPICEVVARVSRPLRSSGCWKILR